MMKKLKKLMRNPYILIFFLDKIGISHLLSDKMDLRLRYRALMHKKLNLKNPVTYTEKLQWLKIYNHDPQYTMMVDKHLVKDYVAGVIGDKYVIPTIGIWDSVDDIPFSALPEQFVLKCTHDSGGVIVVKDKSKMNYKEAKQKLEKCMRRNFYWAGREWPYKNVKPRIIAEEYLEDDSTHELRDYKFFVFDGVVKALFIATDRQDLNKDTAFDFFDMDFRHLDIKNGHPNANKQIDKPKCFEEMKRLASELGKGLPEVRIDFYESNGRVYFGEITFFHHSGFAPFVPEKWDYIFGEWINLPKLN